MPWLLALQGEDCSLREEKRVREVRTWSIAAWYGTRLGVGGTEGPLPGATEKPVTQCHPAGSSQPLTLAADPVVWEWAC